MNFLHRPFDIAGGDQNALALGSQVDTVWQAVEKPHAQELLEVFDAPANGRLGHP